MAALSILGILPIGLRLYGLMIRDHGYYSRKALQNQTRTTLITPERGVIYDRNMNILATSRNTENVYLDPHELRQSKADIPGLSQKLGEFLDKDSRWIEKQARDLTKRYKQVGAKIDEETGRKIRDYINANHLRGIHLEPNAKRLYPFGSLAGQVLGFTNDSGAGSEGVEASYNSFLSGQAGQVITTKGNHEMDMPFSYENYVAGQQGASVVLTLDTTVQACLEKQLRLAIERYDVQNGAFGLVMDVTTGEILGMATLDGYDPNVYLEVQNPDTAMELETLRKAYEQLPPNSEAYTEKKKAYQEALHQAQLRQWRNRCISDGYEPGSTFKVLTMAAALDCGAIDLQTNFHCSGTEQIPGRAQLLHCWKHGGHGAEKTPQALQNSCNIAFAHIALKLGGEKFYEYVQKFGIMEKTGIDLYGESKGVFFRKELVTDTEKWGTASLTSGSFGQTFKLTPLQLVRAIGAVVNGGTLMEPYLISQVVNSEGQTILAQEPTPMRQVIRPETSRIMCELMESVVTEGTAKNAHVSGFRIGGKTGTSEKIDVFDGEGKRVLDKIVSFVGVAPMDHPRYIVLAALDTPSRQTGIYISGGVMAAPTVGAIMGDILPYLGVVPCYDQEDPAGKVCITEDYLGLSPKQAEKKGKEQGIAVRVIGEGERILYQIPQPGEKIPGNGQVMVYLTHPGERQQVKVPSFLGLNRQQAGDLAGSLGLQMIIKGNNQILPGVVVTAQEEAENTWVLEGTAITLEFTDRTAPD